MAAGDATAADVPGKYDVVINGKGYVFADSVEPSLPFRTHRAIYDISPTFVERSNTGQSYGDQTQDFFLTASQNDWSAGEQQRFLHLGDQDSKRRYWIGSNVDVSIPGQVTLQPATKTVSFTNATAGITASASIYNELYVADVTNLFKIDGAGTKTDLGAHGAGAPYPRAVYSDSVNVYIGGSTKIRKYRRGVGFSDFSATLANAIAVSGNTMYAISVNQEALYSYDTAGNATTIYTWKAADGLTSGLVSRLVVSGPNAFVLRISSEELRGAELWQFNPAGVNKVAVFPPNFQADSLTIVNGIVFVGGAFTLQNATKFQSAVYYFANGTTGLLWKSTKSSTNLTLTSTAGFQDGLVFSDETLGALMFYNPSSGGVSTIGSFTTGSITPTNTGAASIGSGGTALGFDRNATTLTFFPDTVTATSGSVASSLIDFDNSLAKMFRGIKVDWQAATDGNGGSVDISYQVDSLDGAYTSLQTGATSGTEYKLTGITGHAISVKITINKGTSTLGPILKRVYVRAAPALQQFKSGLYVIDCTGTAEDPRELRDGQYHPLTGYDQVQNLLTAATSTTPFTVVDKVNGSFTGLVDLSDPEGWDVYEVHPDPDNPKKPGSYMVRVKVREV